MHQKILPKFWMPNSRGTKTHCELCNIKFQILVKQEHQCKRCLRSVCEDCGPERRLLYEADGTSSLHRTCLICMKQIDLIDSYHQQYKLCFGQDSQFVDDWINKLNKQRRDYQSILNEFTENLTGVTNDNVIKFKRQSDQIFSDLLESYNYSFRNFVKVVTLGINPEIFQNKVRNVMVGVYARVKSLPYVAELTYLSIFFLCFANQAHSYFLISRLIEKIFPQYVRVKKLKKDNLLENSLKTILEMYRISLTKVDRNELEAVAHYLEARFIVYILSFSLNVCAFPVSFFIIDQTLKSGNYLPIYKGIASLISNCREQLSSYQSFSEVQIPLLRKVTLEKLKSCFIRFQKSDAKFEVNNELFDSAEHRKLHEKYKQIESLFNKSEKTLSDKEKHLKEMSADLSKKNQEINDLKKKITELQVNLLKLSEHIPQIVKYLSVKETCEVVSKRNIQLQDKCAELQKKIQDDQKVKFKEQRYLKNWAKLEQSYIGQLAALKTKNEIMQIQLAAREVDFNTAYIERKLQEKNIQIKLLNDESRRIKTDLQYYKLKILEKSFSLKNKKDSNNFAKSGSSNSDNNNKQQQFQQHIQSSKQLVDNLTKQAEQLKTKKQELETTLFDSNQKIHDLESRLKQVEEVTLMLKQIPNEYSYEDSIEQLERNITKQTNFMKKKSLEDVKEKFEKCFKELRFRMIDSRLKEEKIKNSPFLKMLKPLNYDQLGSVTQKQNNNLSFLVDRLQTIEDKFSKNDNDDKIPITNDDTTGTNKQCQIM